LSHNVQARCGIGTITPGNEPTKVWIGTIQTKRTAEPTAGAYVTGFSTFFKFIGGSKDERKI